MYKPAVISLLHAAAASSRVPRRALVGAIGSVRRAAGHLAMARRRRRAIAELERLDARLLADLGVERDAIPDLVDRLLARQAPADHAPATGRGVSGAGSTAARPTPGPGVTRGFGRARSQRNRGACPKPGGKSRDGETAADHVEFLYGPRCGCS